MTRPLIERPSQVSVAPAEPSQYRASPFARSTIFGIGPTSNVSALLPLVMRIPLLASASGGARQAAEGEEGRPPRTRHAEVRVRRPFRPPLPGGQRSRDRSRRNCLYADTRAAARGTTDRKS